MPFGRLFRFNRIDAIGGDSNDAGLVVVDFQETLFFEVSDDATSLGDIRAEPARQLETVDELVYAAIHFFVKRSQELLSAFSPFLDLLFVHNAKVKMGERKKKACGPRKALDLHSDRCLAECPPRHSFS